MNTLQNGISLDTGAQVQGYCVHCRCHRPMHGAIQIGNKRGGRDLKGHCGICGKGMYHLGGWDDLCASQLHSSNQDRNTTGDSLQDRL